MTRERIIFAFDTRDKSIFKWIQLCRSVVHLGRDHRFEPSSEINVEWYEHVNFHLSRTNTLSIHSREIETLHFFNGKFKV